MDAQLDHSAVTEPYKKPPYNGAENPRLNVPEGRKAAECEDNATCPAHWEAVM